MFDAKSLIEILMKGASPNPQSAEAGRGNLGDVLGQLGGMVGGGAAGGRREDAAAGGGSGQAAGLDDLLRKLGVGAGDRQGHGTSETSSGGGLGDILGQLQKHLGKPSGSQANVAPGAGPQLGGGSPGMAGGSLIDILGQILAQATSGVKEGAGRIDGATGASGQLRDLIGKATGQSPDELLAKLRDLVANNQMATGAGLGGLGALVLGTRTGRSMAASAAKLGGLALIGGLAYKAYQNWSAGKPPLGTSQALMHEAAPEGSGFEAGAVTHDAAVTYLRAMIAAAAADGRIDPAEQDKILGGLKTAGLESQARQFIEGELASPATIEDLAAAVGSPQEAVQVYTAARVAIEPHSAAEAEFLSRLAASLGLEPALAAHIDAAARAA